MIKTTLQFTDEQVRMLREIAHRERKPFSRVIRDALDQWIYAREEKIPLSLVIERLSEESSKGRTSLERRKHTQGIKAKSKTTA